MSALPQFTDSCLKMLAPFAFSCFVMLQRPDPSAPCPEADLCKLAEAVEPVRATSADGREYDADYFGRNV